MEIAPSPSPEASSTPSPVIPNMSSAQESQRSSINKITVLSPNGGEVFTTGELMKILWDAPTELREVEIAISSSCPKGDVCSPANDFYQTFKAPNTGSYLWLIPKDTTEGETSYTYFSVTIADEFAMHSKYNDSSDSTFTILP